MPKLLDKLEKRFRNTLADLEATIDESVAWLAEKGLGPQSLYLARFIVEEMGTNILKYAYDDKQPHEIFLSLGITPTHLQILLEDDGHEFNPLHAPAPKISAGIDERTPGGLGIWLVQKFGKMQYTRVDGKRNKVEIFLRLDCVIPD